MRVKVTVVGSSNIGATTAQRIAERDYANVVLIDSEERLAADSARDLNDAGAALGYEPNVVGTSDYADSAGSSIVVITCGAPVTSGTTRRRVVSENARMVQHVSEQVKDRSPDSTVITVTEPVGVMCHIVSAVTELPRSRVTGVCGGGDSARLRSLIAGELDVSVHDVSGLVVGRSGDGAVPLMSLAAVSGVPINMLLPDDRLREVVRRVRSERPGVYSSSAAVAEMVDSIALDHKRVLPCAALCQGEYGIDGAFVAVPAVLGAEGIERIVTVDLDEQERRGLDDAARQVRLAVDALAQP